ncbi:MAG: hypothetical protein AAFR13_03940 [Pseudomonadota bacterium]
MPRLIRCTLPLFFLAAMQPVANAQDVEFSGTVNSTCTLTVQQNGILIATDNGRRLRSNTSAGRNGLVQANATSHGFTISAVNPTSFVSQPPADAASPETFAAALRGRLGTIFDWTQSHPINNLTRTFEMPGLSGCDCVQSNMVPSRPRSAAANVSGDAASAGG